MSPIVCTELPSVTLVNPLWLALIVVPKKALAPIVVTLFGIITEVSAPQPSNTLSPMVIKSFGRLILGRAVQPLKAAFLISVTPLGRMMLVKRAWLLKALSPIKVTLSGTKTSVTLGPISQKAPSPIAVTATPPIVGGIITKVPAPLYPVMVTNPPTLLEKKSASAVERATMVNPPKELVVDQPEYPA